MSFSIKAAIIVILLVLNVGEINAKQTTENVENNSVVIKFSNFEVVIDSLILLDENNDLQKIQKDSVVVTLGLGETIEGKTIRISHSIYDEIKLFQRFENSITIMDEGPHCDLAEWKHYYSNWQLIEVLKANRVFKASSYKEDDSQLFIPINIEELKEAVENYCGPEWKKLIENIKSPNEYPSGVGTSRIFIKIELHDKSSNITIEKLLIFEILMGC
jgi:hypothetical protein